MTSRSRSVRSVATATIMLTAVVGCASSSKTAIKRTDASTGAQPTPSLASTPANQPPGPGDGTGPSDVPPTGTLSAKDLVNSVTFKSEAAGGYSASGILRFGRVVSLRTPQSLVVGTMVAGVGSACTVDPLVDAVIPFDVTVTNTTKGFPSEVAFQLNPLARGVNGPDPAIEQAFTAAPTCHSPQLGAESGSGGGVTGELPVGGQATFLGFYIVHNYFSPELPKGDSSLLSKQALYVQGLTDDKGRLWGVQSFDGKSASSLLDGFKVHMSGSA